MNNKTLALCALAAAMALPAVASDTRNVSYDYADVVDAVPLVKTIRVSTPREECWDERVVYHNEPYERQGDGQFATVLGGVIGGALGNEVGHSKKNKQVGAVIGAVVGATAARAITRNNRRHASYGTSYGTEEVCRTYNDYHEEERIIGYQVKYRYNDEVYSTRTDTDPGEAIKVRLAITPVA